ncbi:MAG: ABC transporter ATP-binding protein [Phycisphaerae bacterium]|nr:ABC transporter ATP-binding protein [Phycisphaerae bacterium]
MTSSVLEVVGYTKTYDQLVAVDRLSFSIAPGQVVGMIGPNGAGKTTTMRAIAGIIPPTQGSLRIAGHDVTTDPVAAKAQLAFIPDDPKLFDTLSIWEHLQFIAALYKVDDWTARATELLERFELSPKRQALASELSRGMRQKLAICCAYLHAPQLIMFDEPMTGLDPHAIRALKETIRERSSAGAGILISSHLLALVEDLTSHLLIMNRGSLLFMGSAAEARARFGDDDTSLEDVFFRATESAGQPRPVPPGSI